MKKFQIAYLNSFSDHTDIEQSLNRLERLQSQIEEFSQDIENLHSSQAPKLPNPLEQSPNRSRSRSKPGSGASSRSTSTSSSSSSSSSRSRSRSKAKNRSKSPQIPSSTQKCQAPVSPKTQRSPTPPTKPQSPKSPIKSPTIEATPQKPPSPPTSSSHEKSPDRRPVSPPFWSNDQQAQPALQDLFDGEVPGGITQLETGTIQPPAIAINTPPHEPSQITLSQSLELLNKETQDAVESILTDVSLVF